MNIYITPSQYERAAAYGVSYSTLNARVRNYGWEIELAITTPPKPRNLGRKIPKEWAGIAEANGVNYRLFANRVNRSGWTPERAATTSKEVARVENDRSRRSFTDAELEKIKAIGMTPNGVRHRLSKGWSRDKAISFPVIPRGHRRWYVNKEGGKHGMR